MLEKSTERVSPFSNGNASSQTLRKRSLLRLVASVLIGGICIVTPRWIIGSEMNSTEMIEQGLPRGETIKSAPKTDLLFALCGITRHDLRRTPSFAAAAISPRPEYAKDIVETIIHCAFPTEKVDCELVNSIVADAVLTSLTSASDIVDGAIAAAPSCASEIKATAQRVTATMANAVAASEAEASPSPSAAATVARGPVSGGGGGFNRELKEALVCDNGTERRVPEDQLNDFLSAHPGSAVGPCQPAPAANKAVTTSGKEVIPESGKEVLRSSGKEVLSESGKEVLPASGKEVLPEYGNEAGFSKSARSAFHISVSVRQGYDDNVYTTRSNRVDSFFTKGGVTLDYNFADANTQFDLQAIGGLAYYYDHPLGEEYDVNSSLTLSINHRSTSRLMFAGSAYLAYQSEPDFNNILGIDRRVGNFFYTSDKFSVAYQWVPGFSTATSYTLGAIAYDNSAIGAVEDRFAHTFGNEFRFGIRPATTLVGEYRYQIVDFDQSPRDSTSHFVLAGLDHRFNPRFNISLRGGVEFRDIDNFGERTSPYAETNLTYAALHHTSISWVSRYGLEEPEVPSSPSRKTFRTGLDITSGVLPRLTSRFVLFYRHDDNDGSSAPAIILPAFTEDSIDIGLEVRYEINRIFAVLAGYSHTEVFSDILLREYARNRYYLGLNAAF